MFAVVYVFLLCWCHRSIAGEAELPPPQDVTMTTLNTHYSLNWVWDHNSAEDVTFTTQYLSKYKLKRKTPKWSTACNATSARSCDLTWFNLHYLAIYVVRVRTNADGRHSRWMYREFCPDKDAVVGPPSDVSLTPADGAFQVSISDPLTNTNTSMREHLPELYYRILYWEYSTEGQGPTSSVLQPLAVQTLDMEVNVVNVLDLKTWTWYCVTVQTRYDFYNKSSSFSPPLCVQTKGALCWWQITGYFLGSLIFCFLVMLLLIYGSFRSFKTCKAVFFPEISPSFKERLFDPLGENIPRLISESEPELLYVNVITFPKPEVLEMSDSPAEDFLAVQAGLESDSSGRHSRQDSSTSGDSGVYSTGGTSGKPPHNAAQPFTFADGGWTRGFGPEEVQEAEPKLGGRPAVTDEGVVDVCV